MKRDRAGKGPAKAAAKLAWFRAFGYQEEDAWHHRCQSCGRPLSMRGTDFSHKVPAGRGGDAHGIDPTNGIASCRPCHDWLERGPMAQEARDELVASSANLTNDEVVEWKTHSWDSLRGWLRRWSGPSS